jgi:hypothetical protein
MSSRMARIVAGEKMLLLGDRSDDAAPGELEGSG